MQTELVVRSTDDVQSRPVKAEHHQLVLHIFSHPKFLLDEEQLPIQVAIGHPRPTRSEAVHDLLLRLLFRGRVGAAVPIHRRGRFRRPKSFRSQAQSRKKGNSSKKMWNGEHCKLSFGLVRHEVDHLGARRPGLWTRRPGAAAADLQGCAAVIRYPCSAQTREVERFHRNILILGVDRHWYSNSQD